jgi:hypothetical protein
LKPSLGRSVLQCAEKIGLRPEELVDRAIRWYLRLEAELESEMKDWQRMGLRAWAAIEESL